MSEYSSLSECSLPSLFESGKRRSFPLEGEASEGALTSILLLGKLYISPTNNFIELVEGDQNASLKRHQINEFFSCSFLWMFVEELLILTDFLEWPVLFVHFLRSIDFPAFDRAFSLF